MVSKAALRSSDTSTVDLPLSAAWNMLSSKRSKAVSVERPLARSVGRLVLVEAWGSQYVGLKALEE